MVAGKLVRNNTLNNKDLSRGAVDKKAKHCHTTISKDDINVHMHKPEGFENTGHPNKNPTTVKKAVKVKFIRHANNRNTKKLAELPPMETTKAVQKKGVIKRRVAYVTKKPIFEWVKLEQILGISAASNNSLSYDPYSENILYTAGCVCVLYNLKKSKQTFISNDSKKPLTCAAFSSDGALVVTGESGHRPCVRIWDAVSGSQLRELQGHSFGVSSVSFSPNTKAVVSVGFTHDSTVCVWNTKTGKQVASNKTSSRVFGMSFNEKGTYFVTVGIRFVKFWYFDTNDDKALNQLTPCGNRAALLEEHKSNTFKSVVCGKGKFSHLTFCLSNEGSLFSFGESRRVERWLNLKVNDAFALYVTQDHLLCGCSDGVVRVFEPLSLSHIVNLPKPHPLGVDLAACTSPSSLVSAHPSQEYPDCIGVVADSSTNKVIVLYRDKSLYVWDISNINMIGKHRSYLFHSACVCAIEVYPQETQEKMCLPKGTFITGSSDNTIKIWNLTTLDPDDKIRRNVYSKELLNHIYTDTDFSWMRGKRGNAVSDNVSGVTALAVSPRGDIVASGDKSGNLRVHELIGLSGHELAVIEAHEAEVLALTFTSPDSNWHYLASAGRDRLIHVFDIRNDYSLLQTIDDHSAIVTSLKFVDRSNDSQLTLLSTSADKSVRFRTAAKSGQSLQFSTYQHVQEKSTFNDMEIPLTKDRVITGCQDRQIRTYELSSGKLMGSFKSGGSEDSGMIVNVALDPSNSYLAAAGSDKCIFVHDVHTGDKLASLYGHSEMITGLKFTNDCKRLISTSGDGCIFVWRLGNDVVRNIKQKMKGQGFVPEISAQTPDCKNGGYSINRSPHNDFVVPILGLIAQKNKKDVPEQLADPTPDIQLRDISFTAPPPNVQTPEIKRKKWDLHNESYLLLENLAIEPETPKQFNNIRTAPDGGEESESVFSKVAASASESEKELSDSELVDEQTPETDKEETGAGTDSEGTTPEEQVMYVPPRVRSPDVKRLSHVFDVNVTPFNAGRTIDTDLASEEDDDAETTFLEEEEGQEDLKLDPFLLHKFSEISDEMEDVSSNEQEDSVLSPDSRHRQSMSRKHYKTTSPDSLKATSPNNERSCTPDDYRSPTPDKSQTHIPDIQRTLTPDSITDTPKTKGPSPRIPITLFGHDDNTADRPRMNGALSPSRPRMNGALSPSRPGKENARLAVAEKIAAKKKEKDVSHSAAKTNVSIFNKKNNVAIPEEKSESVMTDQVVHRRRCRSVSSSSGTMKLNLGELLHSKRVDFKDSSGSIGPISLTTSNTSLSDPSKNSDYMSAQSKNTNSDIESGPEKTSSKKNHKPDKKADQPSKQKSIAKKMSYPFGSKTKDEKALLKKENKNGLKKDEKNTIKKEEKLDKATKKSKVAAISKKDSSSTESLSSLKTAFRGSLSLYDETLAQKCSTRRTQRLNKMTGVFREMLNELQLRLDSPENMAGVNGEEERSTAELHAAKCAELCADKILQLVNQKLQINDHNS